MINLYSQLPKNRSTQSTMLVSDLKEIITTDEHLMKFRDLLIDDILKENLTVKEYGLIKLQLCRYDPLIVEISKQFIIESYQDTKESRKEKMMPIINKLGMNEINSDRMDCCFRFMTLFQSNIFLLINKIINCFANDCNRDTDILLNMLTSINFEDDFGILELTRELFRKKYEFLLGNDDYFSRLYLELYNNIDKLCYKVLNSIYCIEKERNRHKQLIEDGDFYEFRRKVNSKKRFHNDFVFRGKEYNV